MAYVFLQGIGGGGGKDEEEKSVALDFSNGNQVITPSSSDTTLSKVTVQKPEAFVAGNIKSGITLGGVEGTYTGESETLELEEKQVSAAFGGGNMVVTPSEGKVLSKVTIEKPAALTPTNIKKDVQIAGVTGVYEGTVEYDGDSLIGLVNGTITNFTQPTGITVIRGHLCYDITTLITADLTAATYIGDRAFRGCTALASLTLGPALTTVEERAFENCKAVASLMLPASVTKYGDYSFQNVGANGAAFEFVNNNSPAVGTYAFSGAKVSKVQGKLGTLGTYAFSGCTNLTTIDVECGNVPDYAFNGATALTSLTAKINGTVGNYAFYNATKAATVAIDTDSVITSLGNYAFSRLGAARENPSENIIELDLRNSKFTTVNQYAFGGDSSTETLRNRYMNIRLPRTVATISGYAFRYVDNCNIYFATDRPPTFSAATAFSNATDYKIFVPYTAVNAYRTATNLTAFADNVVGYAEAGTFAVGEKLPAYNAEGYALTWYKDKSMTEGVTVADDATVEYYCVAGTEKVAYGIKSAAAINATLVITDENGNSYRAGAGVPMGAVLTITAIPSVESYVPYIFTVNDAEFMNGGTYTMDADLKIVAIYYDGVNIPINPAFADNSFLIIGEAFDSGVAWEFWQVGDEKPFTSKSGVDYTLRIIDDEVGRFNKVGGGLSNNYIEIVECYKLNGKTAFPMNSTAKEGYYAGGGFAMSDMKNITLEAIFDDLPDDLQAIIATVEVSTHSYTAPTPRTSECQLFLKSEYEVFGRRQYSHVSEETSQCKWYKEHNTDADRQRCVVGTTTPVYNSLRSPYSSIIHFCGVTSSGRPDYGNAYTSYAVCPCFVIGKSTVSSRDIARQSETEGAA